MAAFRDKKQGWDKRLAAVASMAKGAKVTVGIHAEEGAEAHGEDASIADVASYQEFGTDTIEARPFVSGYADERGAEVKHVIKAIATNVLKGSTSLDQALDQLGVRIQAGMQSRISEGIPPQNAKSTVRQKGSSVPLIDTGLLRASIRYKVER